MPTLTGGAFHALLPARILDTRDGTGGISAPVGPGQTIAVQVAGQGGVPGSGVGSVVMNVTATGPTEATHLTLFPTGDPHPDASSLNLVAGETDPNLVEVKVGVGGQVSVFNNSGAVHVIFDVAGWVESAPPSPGSTAGLFHSLPPSRILDTRDGTGGFSAPMQPGSMMPVTVAGEGGVPLDGVSAVVVNITVVNATAASHVTAFPGDAAVPVASNVNFRAGQVVPNRAIVKVGNDQIVLYNSKGSVDVIVDVTGWFSDGTDPTEAGALFTGQAPQRVLDTRDGTGGVGHTVDAAAPVRFTVAGHGGVPALGGQVPATAVVANITVVGSTAGSHLTVWPGGSPKPLASDLNFSPGQAVPNLTVAKLGPDGSVNIATNSGSVHVIVDVLGFYSGDVLFADNLTILDAPSRSALTAIDATSVTFAPVPPQLNGVRLGDVLVSQPTPNAPGGLLRTVEAITPSGGGLVLTTSDASIHDAVLQGELGDHRALTAEDVVGGVPPLGGAAAPLDAKRPAAVIGSPITTPFDRVLASSGGAEVRLKGSFDLVAHSDLDVKIRLSGISARYEASADESFSAALTATYTASFSKTVTLWEPTFKTFVVFVAEFPVVVTPKVRIDLEASGSVTGTASATVNQSAHAAIGADIDSGGTVTPFSDFSTPPPTFTGPEATVKVDAKGAVVPWVGLEFYEMAQVLVTLSPYVQLQGDECGVHLYAGVDGRFDFKLHVLDKVLADHQSADHPIVPLTLIGSANLGECSDTWTGYVVERRVTDYSFVCQEPSFECLFGTSMHYQQTDHATMHVNGALVDQWSGSSDYLKTSNPACTVDTFSFSGDSTTTPTAGAFSTSTSDTANLSIWAWTGLAPITQTMNNSYLVTDLNFGFDCLPQGLPYAGTIEQSFPGYATTALGTGFVDTGAPPTAPSTAGTKVVDYCDLRVASGVWITCWADTLRVSWRLTRRLDADLDGIPDKDDATPTQADPPPALP